MKIEHFTYQETNDGLDEYSFYLSLLGGGVKILMAAKFLLSGAIELIEPTEVHLSKKCQADIIEMLKGEING